MPENTVLIQSLFIRTLCPRVGQNEKRTQANSQIFHNSLLKRKKGLLKLDIVTCDCDADLRAFYPGSDVRDGALVACATGALDLLLKASPLAQRPATHES